VACEGPDATPAFEYRPKVGNGMVVEPARSFIFILPQPLQALLDGREQGFPT